MLIALVKPAFELLKRSALGQRKRIDSISAIYTFPAGGVILWSQFPKCLLDVKPIVWLVIIVEMQQQPDLETRV